MGESAAEFDYAPLHVDFHVLGKPAQRALITAGLLNPQQIAAANERALLALHGMGPKSLPAIRDILARHGLELSAR